MIDLSSGGRLGGLLFADDFVGVLNRHTWVLILLVLVHGMCISRMC